MWSENFLRRIQPSPPKHVIILFADGHRHRVVMLMYFFCLFPYCVMETHQDVSVDLFKSFFIDPYEGVLSPIIVGGLPVPEVLLSEDLANQPRGGIEQARSAGTYAHKWILKTCEERRVSDRHAFCYECGRVLEAPADLCPHCGKPVFPEPPLVQQPVRPRP
jgi:hypothetical protein